MFSVKGNIEGYGEGYFDDVKKCVCVNAKVVIKIKAEKQFKKYSFITVVVPIPVFVTFKGGVSLAATGEINLAYQENQLLINGGKLEIEPSIYFAPEVGVGVDEVVDIKGKGKIELAWLHRFSSNYDRVSLKGEASIKGTFLALSKEWPLVEGTLVLYDSNRKSEDYIRSYSASANFGWDMSGAEVISMDYLAKRAGSRGGLDKLALTRSSGNTTGTWKRVQEYAYENASPIMVPLQGKYYLFYLDGVDGRKELDQTAVFYRSSSDGGETWSAPVRVDGGANETADYNFDVATDGEKLYIVWSDAGAVYGDELLTVDATEAISQMAKEMNLMLAVIDGATGQSDIYTIATAEADLQPQVTVGNEGDVYVTWITNDVSAEEGVLSNKNKLGLCYATSSDNYAVHSQLLERGYYPLSLDAGLLGEDAYLAAAVDIDGDLETQEDREIFALKLLAGENLLRLTSNDMIESVPTFAKVAETDNLFWYQDGNIAYTSDLQRVDKVFDADRLPSMGQRFSLLENSSGAASIVWASTALTEQEDVEVYAADFGGNAWSDPYRLGRLDSEYTTDISGFLSGADYCMTYLSTVTEGDGTYSHICMFSPAKSTDIAVSYIAEQKAVEGEAYPITLSVMNNGNTTVNQINISSADGKVADAFTGLSIAPGTEQELDWNGIVLPADMTEVYNCELTISAEGETDLSDNIVSLLLGEPDFSIDVSPDYSNGEYFASVNVTNNGILPAGALLKVFGDEEHSKELIQTRLTEMESGESRITVYDLMAIDQTTQVFYFSVTDESGKEIYKEDNDSFLYVGKGIYMEYDNGGGGSDQPGDNPNPPEDNPDQPGDNPDQPGDNPNPPGGNPNPPEDNSDQSGNNPNPPGDNPNDLNKPGDNIDDPGNAENQPGASESEEAADDNADIPPVGLHVKLLQGTVYTYTGAAIKPAIRVTDNGKKLTEGIHYTIKYSNNVNASEGVVRESKLPTVTVTGKNNYSGSVSVRFAIRRKNLAGEDNGGNTVPMLWYPNELYVVKNTKAKPILFYGDLKLGSKNYDLSSTYYNPADSINKGILTKPQAITEDGELYVIGRGNYTGTVKISVKAVDKNMLKKLTVTQSKGFQPQYDGREQSPIFGRLNAGADVEVTAQGITEELHEGKDYYVIYPKDMSNAGTKKYTVIGMGIYTGTITKSYKISPVKASENDMEVSFENKGGSYPYEPAGVTVNNLTVTYRTGRNETRLLEADKDYKITYSNNKKKGNAQIKIAFIGNYKGSKTKTEKFSIRQAYLDDPVKEVKLSLPDMIYKKAGDYRAVPLATVNDELLKRADYNLIYEYQDENGNWQQMDSKNKLNLDKMGVESVVVRVKMYGKGNYSSDPTHALTAEYRVYRLAGNEYDLSKAKVVFYDAQGNRDKFAYTGEEVIPHKVEVTIKMNGASMTLTEGKDYAVTYVNHVNKGKATAIITGTGIAGTDGKIFVGSKKASFSITALNVKIKAIFDNIFANSGTGDLNSCNKYYFSVNFREKSALQFV